MLNIIDMIKKNQIIRTLKKKGNNIYIEKRNIPLSKEWYNSIYSFNKNPINFYPAVLSFVFKLLKIHFNMYNKNLETENKSPKFTKIKRSLLDNKVWVSTPEIRHLNKKAIITFYVYNRLFSKYKRQLSFLEFTWGPVIKNAKKRLFYNLHKSIPNSVRVAKKVEILRRESPIYMGMKKSTNLLSINFYLKMIKWLKLDKFIEMEQYKLSIMELIGKDKAELIKNLNSIKSERYNFLINQFEKELIYLRLKQKMLFSKFKFNELYLVPLINFLQVIYKKEIKLNIVIVKQHYTNSNILAQMVTAKVINKKNRGKSYKPARKAIASPYIPNLSENKIQRERKISAGIQNVIYSELECDKYDSLDKFLLNNKNSKIWSSKYIDNFAIQNIKNKNIAGLFIKISGRLTKRYKAQRAVSILAYRGTLKNVYSAHKGHSSVLSRGYSNINVEKTMIHSKLRIGAFGLTGWVASY